VYKVTNRGKNASQPDGPVLFSVSLYLNNFQSIIIVEIVLSINCKDAGDPVCTHTIYGETEEEVLKNAKEHGYTEESWNEILSKNLEHFKKIIEQV
jgi:predicted small metal-binding protein